MDLSKVKDSLKKAKLHTHPSGEVRAAFVEMLKLLDNLVDYLEWRFHNVETQADVKPLYIPKKPELKKNGKVDKD